MTLNDTKTEPTVTNNINGTEESHEWDGETLTITVKHRLILAQGLISRKCITPTRAASR